MTTVVDIGLSIAGITEAGPVPQSFPGLGHWLLALCEITACHTPRGPLADKAASPGSLGCSYYLWNLPGPGRERSAGHSHGLSAPVTFSPLWACPSSMLVLFTHLL